jgi:Cof subfamily protein (haloacid dehalogenase superfamily)
MWEDALNYRLLALDVDGTLLDSQGRLSPRMKVAVQAARRAGLLVCLVTGRRPRYAWPVYAALELDGPMVALNGAVISDPVTLETLRVLQIPREAVIELLYRWQEAGLSAFAYRHTITPPDVYFAVRPVWEPMARYIATEGENAVQVPCLVRDTDWSPLRLSVGDSEERTRFACELARPYIDGATLRTYHTKSYDATWYYEIYPPTSKADGVRALCERYGVDASQVVAVGDQLNDVEMLELAGLGVAMGNAPSEVKARADLVIGHHDEDGLAVFVESLLV